MPSDAVVTLVVDATGAQAEVRAQLTQIVNDAERRASPIDITVRIDDSAAALQVRRLRTDMEDQFGRLGDRLGDNLTDLTDRVGIGLDDLSASLRDINAQLASLDTGNVTNITNNFNDLNNSVDDADNNTSRLGDTFSRMGSAALSAVTSAARIGVIGSLAAGALPAVAGLVGVIANIAPAAAAGATAFLGMKAATLSLKVGLIGVEDALGQVFAAEPDAEALAAALEKLAPEARAFVLEMQKLRPALDGIRLDVQNRLFQDFDKQLANTAKVALPVLRKAGIDFAGTFNTIGKNVASSAQNLSESGALGRALRSGGIAFNNLARIPGQALNAVVKLAVGGGPLLIRLTDRIGDVADSLTNKLDKAAKSGALKKAIDEAANTIKQLGRIASNIFGAIGNIMETASEAGGGLFGSLEKITQALEDLTATQGFKDVLTALIETGQTLVTTILPLLAQAFQAVAPVIAILAPPIQRIIEMLGAQLGPIITMLGPILELVATAFGNLLIALSPLITAAGTLITAILPVLTPLFKAVNDIIVALTPVIQVLVEELSAALIPVIDALIPIITLLAEFITRVVVAIAPLVERLMPLIVGWFTRWAPVVTFLLEKLTPVIEAVLDFTAGLVEKLIPAIEDVIDWIKDYAAEFKRISEEIFRKIVLPALKAVADFLDGDFSSAWEGAKNVARRAGTQIATNVLEMGTKIREQVERAMAYAVRSFSNGFSRAAQAIATGIADAVGRFAALPGKILSVLGGGLSSLLYNSGRNLIGGFISGMLSKIGDAASAAGSVLGAVRDFFPSSPAKRGPFSGNGYTTYSGQKMMEDLARGVLSRSDFVSTAMQSALTGSPLSAPALAGASTGTGGFGRAVTGALSARVGAPNVTVFLGNELLTDRMRIVVDDRLTDRDRQASQGVRF